MLLESRATNEKPQNSTDASVTRPSSAPESSPVEVKAQDPIRVHEFREERILPTQLMNRYANLAVIRAVFEQLEDGDYFADVPILEGVWAKGKSIENAEEELRETILEWLELKIEDGDRDIPVIESIDLNWL